MFFIFSFIFYNSWSLIITLFVNKNKVLCRKQPFRNKPQPQALILALLIFAFCSLGTMKTQTSSLGHCSRSPLLSHIDRSYKALYSCYLACSIFIAFTIYNAYALLKSHRFIPLARCYIETIGNDISIDFVNK